MTKDRQRYIDLAVRWAPFGGPRDEDIFVNFGVRPRLYFQRVHRMVGDPRLNGIAEHVRAMVLRTCEDRLTGIDERAPTAGQDRSHRRLIELGRMSWKP